MKPLTPEHIRSSIVNASPAEIARMHLPGLHEVVWQEREFLGWRDPQGSQRGYIAWWVGNRPVGILLRAASNRLRPGIGAMCSLCHTPQPATQVLMFSAARGGESGRAGNSIGTYICADLACSIMIRIFPGQSEMLLMRDELVARRSVGLQLRVGRFTDRILETA